MKLISALLLGPLLSSFLQAATVSCTVTTAGSVSGYATLTADSGGSFTNTGALIANGGTASQTVFNCPAILAGAGNYINSYQVLATGDYGGGPFGTSSGTQVTLVLLANAGPIGGATQNLVITGGFSSSNAVPAVPFQLGSTLSGSASYSAFSVNLSSTVNTGTVAASSFQVVISYTLAALPLAPTVTKLITADTLLLGQTTSMTLTLTNPNAYALTGIALSDIFPAGLTPSNAGGSCTPTATIVGQTLSISGVTLGAAPGPGNQCTVTATVAAAQGGFWTNVTNAPTATGPTTITGVASNPDSVLVTGTPVLTKAFSPANIAIAGTSVITFTISNPNATPMTNVAFTDALPSGLIVNQTPQLSNTCGGTVSAASNAVSVGLTGGTIVANSICTITVAVQATTPGVKVNTTSTVAATVNGNNVTGSPATATLNVGTSEVSFLIRYAANLNVGESYVNFTNTGESSTFSFGGNLAQNGEICANVFAYSPDEQLVSCCSCNVTPNALNSLAVKADLGTNTLTPIIPSSLVIKVVATQGGTSCTAASASSVNTAVLQPGLAAWGSTLHALPGTSANPDYGVTETPFSRGTIVPAELTRMAQLCAFIRANGSGYGICKSCRVGGLGASSK